MRDLFKLNLITDLGVMARGHLRALDILEAVEFRVLSSPKYYSKEFEKLRRECGRREREEGEVNLSSSIKFN